MAKAIGVFVYDHWPMILDPNINTSISKAMNGGKKVMIGNISSIDLL